MAVPNIFATATSSIPLSQLDTNFATAITLGSTALYLGNTTTSVAGLTLTGSAFNGTVGATTASTGAFTTVTATGGVDKLTSATGVVSVSAATAPSSGQVLTATSSTVATWQTPSATNLASPGPIGNTTPSTGAFTTVTTTTSVAVGGSTLSGSGSGVQFPATQSASTNANTLDDYEEGTWTPSVGGTATYSIQTGTYVKIGQNVTAWFDMQIASIGTGSTVNVSGLPFSANASAPVLGGECGYIAGSATNIVSVFPRLNASGTTIVLGSLTAAAASVGSSALLADATRIVVTMTYQANA